jgi:hypothetical protein
MEAAAIRGERVIIRPTAEVAVAQDALLRHGSSR